MKHPLLSVLGMTLLAGCQSLPQQQPPFTAVELTQPARIDSGAAKAYFRTQFNNKVNTHNITCSISVNDISDGSEVIEPDTFTVTNYYAQRERDDYSGSQIDSLFECSNPYFNASYFDLHSPRQPNVRRLVCRELLNTCNGYHDFTYDEIQSAFGNRAILK